MLTLAAASSQSPPSIAERVHSAAEALRAQRHEEAIQLYEQIVRQLPNEPELLANLAVAYHLNGQYEESISTCQRALRLNRGLLTANLFLGMSYLKVSKSRDAVHPLRQVLQSDPENPEALLGLGVALLAERDYAASIESFEKASKKTANPEVWYQLGKAYLRLGDELVSRIRLLDPEKASIWARLLSAEIELGRGQLTYARRDLAHLVADAPSLAAAHLGLAELNEREGELEGARQSRARFDRLVADCAEPRVADVGGGGDPSALLFAASCHYYRSKYRESFSRAAKVLKNEPASLEALYWQANSCKRIAVANFERLSATAPDSFRSYQLQGQIHAAAGRLGNGIQAFEQAILRNPSFAALHLELSMLYRDHSEYDLALGGARKAYELSPNDFEAKYVLGDIYLKKRDFSQAIAFLEDAAETAPEFFEARVSLAKAYRATGKIPEAIRELQAALPIDRAGEIHYQLAGLYRRLGQQENAATELKIFQKIRAEREAAARKRGIYGIR